MTSIMCDGVNIGAPSGTNTDSGQVSIYVDINDT